jgi:hypothetical protein
VLDLFNRRTFTSRDFVELPNGVCRLCAPLSHELALTLPHWRTLVRPVVANLAQAFRDALSNPDAPHRARMGRGARDGRAGLATIQSPLVATPRKTSQPRPYASRAWGALRPESLARIPSARASCGVPVQKRRRRYCEACLPAVTRERLGSGQRTTRRGERRAPPPKPRRRRSHDSCQRTAFLRNVTPRLDSLSLTAIAEATGLTMAYCSKVRNGKVVPHRRHWAAFVTLTGIGPLS